MSTSQPSPVTPLQLAVPVVQVGGTSTPVSTTPVSVGGWSDATSPVPASIEFESWASDRDASCVNGAGQPATADAMPRNAASRATCFTRILPGTARCALKTVDSLLPPIVGGRAKGVNVFSASPQKTGRGGTSIAPSGWTDEFAVRSSAIARSGTLTKRTPPVRDSARRTAHRTPSAHAGTSHRDTTSDFPRHAPCSFATPEPSDEPPSHRVSRCFRRARSV